MTSLGDWWLMFPHLASGILAVALDPFLKITRQRSLLSPGLDWTLFDTSSMGDDSRRRCHQIPEASLAGFESLIPDIPIQFSFGTGVRSILQL